MGKILIYFYLTLGIVGILSIVLSLFTGKALLVPWLFFASISNFICFYLVRRAEQIKMKERRRPRLVRVV